MPYIRKIVNPGLVASYCELCGHLVVATKLLPKEAMLKHLALMERIHHCRGEAKEAAGHSKAAKSK